MSELIPELFLLLWLECSETETDFVIMLKKDELIKYGCNGSLTFQSNQSTAELWGEGEREKQKSSSTILFL